MLKAHIDFSSASAMMRHEMRSGVSSFDFFYVAILGEGVSKS